jgi:hypothetical protein
MADIFDKRFAYIGRERQPVVALPFAAYNDLVCPPADVIALDSNDLRCATTETRERQRHGIIAPTTPKVIPRCGDHRFDLLRRQITQQAGIVAVSSHAGDAKREVRCRQPFLKRY